MKTKQLSNLFEEKIINTDKGTLFGKLISLHGLTKVKDNIYISKGKRKYYLTKYGLKPVEEYSHRMELQKIQHELELVSANLSEVTKEKERWVLKCKAKSPKTIINNNVFAVQSVNDKLKRKNLLYLNMIEIADAEKKMIKGKTDIQYYYDKSNEIRNKIKLEQKNK